MKRYSLSAILKGNIEGMKLIAMIFKIVNSLVTGAQNPGTRSATRGSQS